MSKEKSEQLSFWQLIQKTTIEIPIIQRDYAQGRQEQYKIREKFLNSLYDGLFVEFIELDFIYGNFRKEIYYPLDGQQRLTTLFLLHWYSATKESRLDNTVKKILKKFTYTTRISTREFCENLIEKSIDFSEITQQVDKAIKNTNWFIKSWEKDPSIKAMLIMLNDIHNKFKDAPQIWSKLVDEKASITFHYIELENLGLSDDLYIKMNARGKQLTTFEHFKASFEKYIADEGWDIDKVITETFAHKIDTNWTDLFWRNTVNKNLSFDLAFYNFIVASAINSIALSNQKEKAIKIRDIINNPENLEVTDFDKQAYLDLYDSFEKYNKKENISAALTYWYLNESNVTFFNKVIAENVTYPQRVMFFAQTEFLLIESEFNQSSFDDWMRVIRNIVMSSLIDSSETFIGALNLIEELAPHCSNIYHYLAKGSIKSGFAADQMKEEILKAKIIQKIPNSKSVIFDAEDTRFSKGEISFSFYCIDCIDETTFDGQKLENITHVIRQHFSKEDVSNDFRRALLTIRDGEFYNYWWSWLYAADSNKRKLIADIYDLWDIIYSEYKDYLKELLNQLTQKELTQIIKDFKVPKEFPNWKRRLIKEEGLLDYSEKHYIAIPEDNSCCYLIPQSKVANNDDGLSKLKEVT